LLKTDEQNFRIIDTAGIRRKGKPTAMAEKLSVVMARKSLDRADVAIVLLDADEGVTRLTRRSPVTLSRRVVRSFSRSTNGICWLTKTRAPGARFERKLRDQMKFLSWAPVVTTSALTGQRVQRVLPLAVRANAARSLRITDVAPERIL
jgi:GTP-binding protein